MTPFLLTYAVYVAAILLYGWECYRLGCREERRRYKQARMDTRTTTSLHV